MMPKPVHTGVTTPGRTRRRRDLLAARGIAVGVGLGMLVWGLLLALIWLF
jgi:hypothetical protein